MKIFMHCPSHMINTPRSLNHVIFHHDEQPAAEEGNQKGFCLHASLGTSSAADNNETARSVSTTPESEHPASVESTKDRVLTYFA